MGKGKKGFTLVELTIVIAVIAILAAVMIPTFAVVIGNANKSADLQTLIDLNRMLFSGEIEVESLKEIKLKTLKWELAYSRNENVLVIVDDEDIIVEPETSIFLGEKISGTNYARISKLEFAEPGSGNEHKGEGDSGDEGDDGGQGGSQGGDSGQGGDEHEGSGGNEGEGGGNEPGGGSGSGGSEGEGGEYGNEPGGEGQGDEEPKNWWDGVTPLNEVPDYNYAGEDLVLSDDIDGSQLKEKNFENNKNIKRVYLGNGITVIPKKCFNGCTNLEEVYLAGEKITIGKYAFYGCSKLKSINFEEVSVIEEYALNNCTNLKEIVFTNNLTSLYYDALNGCAFTSLTMPCVKIEDPESSMTEADVSFNVETLKLVGGSAEVKFCNWLNLILGGEQGSTPQEVYIENCNFYNENSAFKGSQSKIYIDKKSYDTLSGNDRALFDDKSNDNYIKQWEQNNA